jgi:L,D-transpeptidase catalytic domain
VLRLRSRTISVLRSGLPVRRLRAVIGAPATPTPRGLFAVAEIRQPNAGGFLGPWALHLTSHSNTLDNFGGGPGRVALHGRGGASLADPLGSARSHGCIRVNNEHILWLAHRIGAGTPVRIKL